MPFKDECGVFGISSQEEAARQTYLGLYALQHRGQEAAGMCTREGGILHQHKAPGHVADVFSASTLDSLHGDAAIGHTRYSSNGSFASHEAQPFMVYGRFGPLALCHNGNIINTELLRNKLLEDGHTFNSMSDSEVILALINTSKANNLEDAVEDALRQIIGAFSLLILSDKHLIAVKDPHGLRPLSVAKLGESSMLGEPSIVFASESCAFDLLGAEYMRELEAGEMLIQSSDGLHSRFPNKRCPAKPCVFEHVYFARPDSYVFMRNVMATRRAMGRQLAIQHPVDADVVIPVPDSGVHAALGYAEQSGIRFEFGMIRNHYVGRTFIEPKQSIRSFGVKVKLNPVKDLLHGRRVVLIDDSIVRGTTSKKIVGMVRDVGAKEVHVRISSPPTTHPCFYGIDTPTVEHLIASSKSTEEIRQFIGADSLDYINLEGLYTAMQDKGGCGFCYACFNGNYPIPRT
ncbi:MAG: amidophosphoribosyltransferase [Holophagaceae bacterium]|nr:amidophosphoribosyltransferase [Holophagaceae bacterium]